MTRAGALPAKFSHCVHYLPVALPTLIQLRVGRAALSEIPFLGSPGRVFLCPSGKHEHDEVRRWPEDNDS